MATTQIVVPRPPSDAKYKLTNTPTSFGSATCKVEGRDDFTEEQVTSLTSCMIQDIQFSFPPGCRYRIALRFSSDAEPIVLTAGKAKRNGSTGAVGRGRAMDCAANGGAIVVSTQGRAEGVKSFTVALTA